MNFSPHDEVENPVCNVNGLVLVVPASFVENPLMNDCGDRMFAFPSSSDPIVKLDGC